MLTTPGLGSKGHRERGLGRLEPAQLRVAHMKLMFAALS